ncbi:MULTISPECIES: hypothetical protein [Pseudoalteromonas]|uniref:Uncharacterized protein n=1 Tax=Pseudoalteromonas luteoviolacea (strain 2ta16) TaxID=1353533 RepID=V4HQZ5_PSEL2|nr:MULTISPECIES: hypothetical protein [Pseudoalteromonas]ESP92218.1 hypothetical protein PL2TA16_05055 [Pseudoalteromonas luteoviolacea 2ta16]KZN29326.1 hypothetical protein N483_07780 [Pseudoalteromonas luteoviolacea NCIMB 1944]MCG7549344.1 hypothetical protein [Pseudoalteromonas sp. Of7M-16]
MMIKTLAFAGALSLLSFESAATMNLAAYQSRAQIDSEITGRCVYSPLPYHEMVRRIDWAVNQGLITKRAADWGKAYSYYPVIDFFSFTIGAVCSGSGSR